MLNFLFCVFSTQKSMLFVTRIVHSSLFTNLFSENSARMERQMVIGALKATTSPGDQSEATTYLNNVSYNFQETLILAISRGRLWSVFRQFS